MSDLSSCNNSLIHESSYRRSNDQRVLQFFTWWSFLKTEGNHILIMDCTPLLRKHRLIRFDVLLCPLSVCHPFGKAPTKMEKEDGQRCCSLVVYKFWASIKIYDVKNDCIYEIVLILPTHYEFDEKESNPT